MKLYIQRGSLGGVESELKRLIKPDREYTVELKETKRSRKKRLKNAGTHKHLTGARRGSQAG